MFKRIKTATLGVLIATSLFAEDQKYLGEIVPSHDDYGLDWYIAKQEENKVYTKTEIFKKVIGKPYEEVKEKLDEADKKMTYNVGSHIEGKVIADVQRLNYGFKGRIAEINDYTVSFEKTKKREGITVEKKIGTYNGLLNLDPNRETPLVFAIGKKF